MKELADRFERLECAQREAERSIRRWRTGAIGMAAVALMLGMLQPGVAANGNGNGNSGGVEELTALVQVLTDRVVALETKLARVTASEDGNDLYITGANLHVRNSTGGTYVTDGTGNLIIGYNEPRDGGGVRTGSHNLVVGGQHSYSSFGGIVSGFGNSITGVGASALGGYLNTASGAASMTAGGAFNSAEAFGAAIIGGTEHRAFGTVNQDWMTIVGGFRNKATAWGATVTGGVNLTVSTPTSWMAGGNTSPAYFAP